MKTIKEIDRDLEALTRQIAICHRVISDPETDKDARNHFQNIAILTDAQKSALHILRVELYNQEAKS